MSTWLIILQLLFCVFLSCIFLTLLNFCRYIYTHEIQVMLIIVAIGMYAAAYVCSTAVKVDELYETTI